MEPPIGFSDPMKLAEGRCHTPFDTFALLTHHLRVSLAMDFILAHWNWKPF
jgi:hypothetical protein